MANVKVRNTTVNGGMTGRDKSINKVFAFRNGKSYSQMKRYGASSAPATVAQQAVRDTFSQTSAGWSGLAEVERAGWNSAAPDWINTDVFGNKSQSGKNLYTGCNVTLVNAGRAKIDSPLSKDATSEFGDASIEVNAGVMEVLMTPTTFPAEETVVVEVGKIVSLGTYSPKKGVTITSINGTGGAPIALDITALYEAKYGAIVAGRKVAYTLYLVSSGGNKTVITSNIINTD